VYQKHVFSGTGATTAFLTTIQVDEEIATLVSQHFKETLPAAKTRMEQKILTKSNTAKTGLAPTKIRSFVKRVLPRWQEKFSKLLMEGFHEQACAILKTGKKSGKGTRGHISTLQKSDGRTCLKDNWFFATPNGRIALNYAVKHAFTKLGCLSSVYVEATVEQAGYLKMRMGLYARIVSTVRYRNAGRAEPPPLWDVPCARAKAMVAVPRGRPFVTCTLTRHLLFALPICAAVAVLVPGFLVWL